MSELGNSAFEHNRSNGTEFHDGDRIDTSQEHLSENVVPYSEFQRRQAIHAARAQLEEVHRPEVARHPNGAEIVGRASAALYFFRQQEVLTSQGDGEAPRATA